MRIPYTVSERTHTDPHPSSVDIPLSEGPVNLNWGPIMKTINEDPYDFFQQGGWTFLGGAPGDDVCRSPISFPALDLTSHT